MESGALRSAPTILSPVSTRLPAVGGLPVPDRGKHLTSPCLQERQSTLERDVEEKESNKSGVNLHSDVCIKY